MIRLLVTILLIFPLIISAKDAFDFDEGIASKIAKAYLISYFDEQPERLLVPVIWSDFLTHAVIDGNNREFVFVVFYSQGKTNGAVMYLEHCNKVFVPSWYGYSSDINTELNNFKKIKDNKEADYPGSCDLSG